MAAEVDSATRGDVMIQAAATAKNEGAHRARRPRFLLAMAATAILGSACSAPPEPGDSAVVPTTESSASRVLPAPPVAPPQVVLPDRFRVTLELAITPEELSQGLMFRPSLPADRGMLLIFAEERLPNIWMMNTLVALDLVYLDRAGVVADVITDAQPCPEEPCPRFTPKRPAQAVLEIPAGSAVKHAIEEGVALEFTGVPDYPASP